MKRITICIDVQEHNVTYAEQFVTGLYEQMSHVPQLVENWDTCVEEVKDDEDIDESQQALVEGHLEEKGLIKLTSAEEMSLDDLIKQVIDNHGCTEEIALRTIQARCHTDSDLGDDPLGDWHGRNE